MLENDSFLGEYYQTKRLRTKEEFDSLNNLPKTKRQKSQGLDFWDYLIISLLNI